MKTLAAGECHDVRRGGGPGGPGERAVVGGGFCCTLVCGFHIFRAIGLL